MINNQNFLAIVSPPPPRAHHKSQKSSSQITKLEFLRNDHSPNTSSGDHNCRNLMQVRSEGRVCVKIADCSFKTWKQSVASTSVQSNCSTKSCCFSRKWCIGKKWGGVKTYSSSHDCANRPVTTTPQCATTYLKTKDAQCTPAKMPIAKNNPDRKNLHLQQKHEKECSEIAQAPLSMTKKG